MNKKKDQTLKRVLAYAAHYRFLIFISMLMAVCSAGLTLYAPVLAGNAVDYIIGPSEVDFAKITRILVTMAIVVAITALCQFIMSWVNNKITFQVVRDVRTDAFNKIQILPFNFLDTHPTGETVSRIIADVDQFADGLLMGFTQLFTGIVTIVGTLIFMFYLSGRIALIVVILTPVSLLVAKFIATKSFNLFREQSTARADQTALVEEMIDNLRVVKAFSHEDENLEKFDEINERLANTSLKATFFSSLTNPSTRVVNNIVYACVALVGGISCITGNMTVGGLTIFLSYATQYTKPFNEISGVVTELQNALACAKSVFTLIDEEAQVPDVDNPADISEILGKIDVENVDFSYTKDKPLIENLNLDIKAGQRVAIVGPTGCGKSTFIGLLMRFYDVDEGSIKIEGKDIRDIRRHDLRSAFGMVLQETWLKRYNQR